MALPSLSPLRSHSVFVECVPPKTTAQQNLRVFNGRIVRSRKQIEGAAPLLALLGEQAPPEPLSGALSVTLEVVWPWRKSDLATRAGRELAQRSGRLYVPVKPDLDNYAKGVLDWLVALQYLERDELVVELILRKFVGAKPGLGIRIEEVG